MSIIKIKSPPSLCDLEQHVAIYLKDADISIMCYIVCTFLSHMKDTYYKWNISVQFNCVGMIVKNDLSSDNKF